MLQVHVQISQPHPYYENIFQKLIFRERTSSNTHLNIIFNQDSEGKIVNCIL